MNNGFQDNTQSTGVYLSAVLSLGSFITSYFTASNVAWVIGCLAGIITIIVGILTVREKMLSVKMKRIQLQRLIDTSIQIHTDNEQDDDD